MYVDDLLNQLEKRIVEYKKLKSLNLNDKGIKVIKQHFAELIKQVKYEILNDLKSYMIDQSNMVIKVCHFYEKDINRLRSSYEEEISDYKQEISRQYKVISLMKQEVEDLMILVNSQQLSTRMQPEGSTEYSNKIAQEDNQVCNSNHRTPIQTISGLQIIEEEETDRTIVSSANRSFSEDLGQSMSKNQNNFIRIQEKESDQIVGIEICETLFQSNGSIQNENEENQNQDQFGEHANNIKVNYEEHAVMTDNILNGSKNISQKRFDSEEFYQRRHNTYNYNERQSGQLFGNYQSVPLSFDRQPTQKIVESEKQKSEKWNKFKQIQLHEAHLKDITNQNREENERQTKNKLFLEQFRKTFNKCLSSVHMSKKYSNSNVKEAKSTKPVFSQGLKSEERSEQSSGKSKSNSDLLLNFQKNKSNQHVHKIHPTQISYKSQNQKLINDMLRDIDNNNKFYVGTKKLETRYEGEKKQQLRNGTGVLFYSNGLCYEGEFRNNLRHGYGVLKFNHIQIYSGDWQNDEIFGQGKIRNFAVINKKKSQNSNSPLLKWISYCGDFKSNRFEGEGTLYLQGGEKFLGKFICGMACGQGTLFKKNGEVENGIWRNNLLVDKF